MEQLVKFGKRFSYAVFSLALNLAVAITCASFFFACSSVPLLSRQGNKYQYNYVMTSPVYNETMVYRDSTVYIQFRFDDSALRFQLQNISSSRLELNWAKVSLGIKGKVFSIRNGATLYSSSAAAVRATVLAPLGYFTDFVIPEKNLSTDGTYREFDLLPTSDKNNGELRQEILSNVGATISLLLPVKVGAASKEYTFTFTVASVDQIPWSKAKVAKRPPRPIKTTELFSTDQYITAGIVVAVIGVASYFLTAKKSPPSE